MSIDVDIAIVVGFLLLNLGVGLYYGQGVKTIGEYALGGRNFTTATLTATIIATWIGGDNFALYLSETYTEGLFFILSSFGALAAFLIVGYFYAPRMKEFLGSLSIAEAMGTLYGKHTRLITALVGFVLITTMVSIQFKIASTMLSHLLGISAAYTTIASAVVVIIYSSLGGIKSVTFTDIVQFFTFGSVIPLIALIVWSGIDDVDVVVTTLQSNPLFDMGILLDYNTPRFWSFLTLMLLFIIPGFDPSTFQRMSMSRDINQFRNAFIYAAFAVLVVQLLISWISVLILSKESGLDANNLFGYILENYSYVGLKGIFVVGVLTMVMSTADSSLNSGAVMFAYDIANTLRIIKPNQELLVSRISVVVIGSVALLLALRFDNLFELFIFGYSFYMPIVTVPFTLAVLGFRTSSKTALVGMASGFLTALGWMFLDTEVDSVIPGLLANLFAMLAYHYITSQPGGWSPKPKNTNLSKISILKKNC
ncbi:MAG: sodium:solute symporter family protein [Rickettsiaceae bacterium]|nr:sodium:solute symporter family protein [Rickettsiaceae bacterium]